MADLERRLFDRRAEPGKESIGWNAQCLDRFLEHSAHQSAPPCVRGTDALDNMGEPACAALTVQYAFKGFFSPIRMGKENKANAGRTIPVKWQLKTADGKPVSDKNSFVAVKTYPVDCVTLTGDPAATTVEKFPGKSGLRYQGSGKWMFNWKTDKAYKATCRMMFVEFTGGQKSPEVLFRFK